MACGVWTALVALWRSYIRSTATFNIHHLRICRRTSIPTQGERQGGACTLGSGLQLSLTPTNLNRIKWSIHYASLAGAFATFTSPCHSLRIGESEVQGLVVQARIETDESGDACFRPDQQAPGVPAARGFAGCSIEGRCYRTCVKWRLNSNPLFSFSDPTMPSSGSICYPVHF